jgi:hypothetical protein
MALDIGSVANPRVGGREEFSTFESFKPLEPMHAIPRKNTRYRVDTSAVWVAESLSKSLWQAMSLTELAIAVSEGAAPQTQELSHDEDSKQQVLEDADNLQLVSDLIENIFGDTRC